MTRKKALLWLLTHLPLSGVEVTASMPIEKQLEEKAATTIIQNDDYQDYMGMHAVPAEVLVNIVRSTAKKIEGTDPRRSVIIEFSEETSPSQPGATGYQSGGHIRIKPTAPRPIDTILHEAAHAMTPRNPTNEWHYDGHSTLWLRVYKEAKQKYEEMIQNWG